jgi:hypothetical protein
MFKQCIAYTVRSKELLQIFIYFVWFLRYNQKHLFIVSAKSPDRSLIKTPTISNLENSQQRSYLPHLTLLAHLSIHSQFSKPHATCQPEPPALPDLSFPPFPPETPDPTDSPNSPVSPGP